MTLSEHRKPRCRGSRPLVLRGGNPGSEGRGPFSEGRAPRFRRDGFPSPRGTLWKLFSAERAHLFRWTRTPVTEGRVPLCRATLPRLPRDGPPLSSVGDPFPEERDPLFFRGTCVPPVRGTETPLSRGTGAHFTSACYPLNEVPVALSVGRESLFLGREITLFRGTRATLPRDGCPVTD